MCKKCRNDVWKIRMSWYFIAVSIHPLVESSPSAIRFDTRSLNRSTRRTLSNRSIWLTCGNPIESRNRSSRCREIPGFRGESPDDPTTIIAAIPRRPSRPATNSRQTTWRNERTKEVQERVTWTSHGVDSYTLPANLTSRARFLSARRPNTCKAHTCRRWA